MQHALQGVTFSQLIKIKNETEIKTAVDLAIVKAVTKLNLKYNLQDHQVSAIVNSVLRVYKHETLEDLILCLNKGISGKYQNDGIIYTIDISVINMWMQKHLEEKADARQRQHQEQKYPSQDNEAENNEGILGLLLKKKEELKWLKEDEEKEQQMNQAVKSYKYDPEKQAKLNAQIDKQIQHGSKKEGTSKKPK